MQDYNDKRTQYQHQAVMLSTGGVQKALYTNPDLFHFNLDGLVEFTYDASDGNSEQVIGWVPEGCRIMEIVNLAALAATSTVTVKLPAHGGEGEVTIVDAKAATAIGPLDREDAAYTPVSHTRPLSVIGPVGVGTQTGNLLVRLAPKAIAWK